LKQNLSLKEMRAQARRLLWWQGGVTLLMSVLSGAIFNVLTAYSVFWGGAICVLANAYFIFRFFSCNGAKNAAKIVGMMWWGELTKLLLSGILFVLAVRFAGVKPLPFLVAYLINSFLYLMPFIWIHKE
jgi:F0F1-type ATP synthase assembly protein I